MDVQADHRHSGMVRRFDLLDAIVNLSSKPVSACQPSRRTAAGENRHNIDESNQRAVKCAVIAKAVGTALHKDDGRTNIVSRSKRYAMWTDLVFGRLLGVLAGSALIIACPCARAQDRTEQAILSLTMGSRQILPHERLVLEGDWPESNLEKSPLRHHHGLATPVRPGKTIMLRVVAQMHVGEASRVEMARVVRVKMGKRGLERCKTQPNRTETR